MWHIPDLHLRLVVALHHLRGEILQTEGGLQGGPHSIQVGAQSRCLEWAEDQYVKESCFTETLRDQGWYKHQLEHYISMPFFIISTKYCD